LFKKADLSLSFPSAHSPELKPRGASELEKARSLDCGESVIATSVNESIRRSVLSLSKFEVFGVVTMEFCGVDRDIGFAVD
jgi:hypothetical protein